MHSQLNARFSQLIKTRLYSISFKQIEDSQQVECNVNAILA